MTDDSDLEYFVDFEQAARRAKLREASILASVAGADGVQLEDGDGRTLIVSADTVEPGQYRISAFDKYGPWGHTCFDTFEEAVLSAAGCYTKSGPAYGGPAYRITQIARPERTI